MKTSEYITPDCCDKAKQTKVVRLGLYPEKNDEKRTWKGVKPKWYVVGDEVKYGEHWEIKVEIERCPFCGKELPDVELNDTSLKIADGSEEYCETCGKRHMCCECYPPAYRWKPKKSKVIGNITPIDETKFDDQELTPLPLMTMLKEASAKLSAKIETGIAQGNQRKVFSSVEQMNQFFEPFFRRQSECKDLEFFINLVLLHRQYGFIGGGILKPEGTTIKIR